jgi:hypothetical protein
LAPSGGKRAGGDFNQTLNFPTQICNIQTKSRQITMHYCKLATLLQMTGADFSWPYAGRGIRRQPPLKARQPPLKARQPPLKARNNSLGVLSLADASEDEGGVVLGVLAQRLGYRVTGGRQRRVRGGEGGTEGTAQRGDALIDRTVPVFH